MTTTWVTKQCPCGTMFETHGSKPRFRCGKCQLNPPSKRRCVVCIGEMPMNAAKTRKTCRDECRYYLAASSYIQTMKRKNRRAAREQST